MKTRVYQTVEPATHAQVEKWLTDHGFRLWHMVDVWECWEDDDHRYDVPGEEGSTYSDYPRRYQEFLEQVAGDRGIDTLTLHNQIVKGVVHDQRD